jgi:hypothetical protein
LKKIADTAAGPTGPRGAAREAKYPIQNPRNPVAANRSRQSGAK